MSMASLLPLVPVSALLGFVLLALAPLRFSRGVVIGLGVGCAIVPALLMLPVALFCFGGGCETGAVATILTLHVGALDAQIAMALDPLSVVAGITVAVIGALVMIYAGAYMSEEPVDDLRRFFAYMNLFLAGMLAVVLAADVLLLFLGWETIGLCSFFLIAYYTQRPNAVAAGTKALVTTRVADTMLLAGLMLLFLATGTTRFDGMLAGVGSIDAWHLAPIAGLIAIGALGKSAQIPFHTWLPSAMAGPTPVSALLHSATMVAAGVILLVRLAPLFAAAPEISAGVALLGLATALLAALTALLQTDVKKLLAFSTMSQIGFMVLALGIDAPAAALAHFAIHAVFKSLLFLSAGIMSHGAHGDTAIDALRGSRRRQPLAFWTFAIGAAALAGLPLLTAGWYSKEAVLGAVLTSGLWGVPLWALAVGAVLLTGTYSFRVVLVAAEPGPDKSIAPWEGLAVWVPLLVLAVLVVGSGLLVDALIRFDSGAPRQLPWIATLLGAAAPLAGLALARHLMNHPQLLDRLRTKLRHRKAFRIDSLYYLILTRGFRRLSHALAGPSGEQAVAHVEEPPIDVVKLVAGDPIGRALVAAATRLVRTVVAAFDPDRIDLVWMRFARALGRGWEQVHRIQTGRVRDQSLGLALGFAGLLLFAWGTSWR
ncbi:MAG TPA: NADH-quinone oxidoreductase subunit L [Rhodopseudomonas sp.]|uniref:NADH-quinone oxidoreductase subunit 5 family protein n=1 Tax=Rhodopseudomonas sp. TaxID=1078 RepID=UPI002EDB1AA0